MKDLKDLNLIRKIAWSFHQTTGVDYQELFSEAAVTYCNLLKEDYQIEKSKFSYWAWLRMEQSLINFIKKEKQYSYRKNIPDISWLPEPFSEFFEELPEECKELAQIVLDHSDEFFNIKPKFARGQIVEILRSEGWTWERIWDSIREMKNYLAYN